MIKIFFLWLEKLWSKSSIPQRLLHQNVSSNILNISTHYNESNKIPSICTALILNEITHNEKYAKKFKSSYLLIKSFFELFVFGLSSLLVQDYIYMLFSHRTQIFITIHKNAFFYEVLFFRASKDHEVNQLFLNNYSPKTQAPTY